MRKLRFFLAAAAASLCLVSSGMTGTCQAADKTLRIGASPTPHAEILRAAADQLKAKGIVLKIVEYSDYVQPNVALNSGELDANYFQHKPYLDDFNKQKGTKLEAIAFIHYEPFGIYAGRSKDLKNIKKGAIVSVPNDTTNEARALLLLQDLGLIKLKNTSLTVTRLDIAENPHKLNIKEIEAPQLVRSLPDVDFAVINGNYAILGGLQCKDALATEAADSLAASTYANIIAVKTGTADDPALKTLCEVLKSEPVKKFMLDKYNGGVVPASGKK